MLFHLCDVINCSQTGNTCRQHRPQLMEQSLMDQRCVAAMEVGAQAQERVDHQH